jgi:phosphoribosyl-AMP cyclohydrolase / phosphoribosyl-ATP pyrophosphohydrolase
MVETFIQNIRFDDRGLIPAIVQDASSSEVLALCYMDDASLVKTLQTGQTVFSAVELPEAMARRSFRLLDVRVNSGGSSLTVIIERESSSAEEKPPSLLRDLGEAQRSNGAEVALVDVGSMEFGLALDRLYTLVSDRKERRPEGSYTTYLFNSGLDKILKKIAEESGEVIIAAKNKNAREIVSELADLFYHLLVLMVERDIKLSDVHKELTRRASSGK